MLAAVCRQCRIPLLTLRNGSSSRHISTTYPALARKKNQSVAPTVSKKKQQAKERRRVVKRIVKERKIDEPDSMPLLEAIRVLRAVEAGRKNSTFELTIKTFPWLNSTTPRGRIAFPYAVQSSKTDNILVFAEGTAAREAKEAGADIVGGSELIEGVIAGKYKSNVLLATPSMLKVIAPRLGRILGPKGLMPAERRGTVLDDPATYIKKLKSSKQWTADSDGTIRTPVGKMNFTVPNLVKNVLHFVDTVSKVTRQQDLGSKSDPAINSIKRVILSSQQGPGIKISDVI